MTPHERAKTMFPNMPDEVFNLWLAPLIASDGWPFTSINSLTHHTIWFRYLIGHPLKMVHDLRWNHKSISCTPTSFHEESLQTLFILIETYVHGVPTPAAKLKEGKGREVFYAIREFIERTGEIPAPVILVLNGGKYHLMDGNHRIAALFSLGLNRLSIDAWVGENLTTGSSRP